MDTFGRGSLATLTPDLGKAFFPIPLGPDLLETLSGLSEISGDPTSNGVQVSDCDSSTMGRYAFLGISAEDWRSRADVLGASRNRCNENINGRLLG